MKRRPESTLKVLTRRAVDAADREQLVALLREEATWHDEDSAMGALLLRAADALLEAGGITIDAVSASNMRHVLRGIRKIRAADELKIIDNKE